MKLRKDLKLYLRKLFINKNLEAYRFNLLKKNDK